MHLEGVREVARACGIALQPRRKVELIRTIQRREGHEACFARPTPGPCLEWDCLWREDCLPARKRRQAE